jgi:hypothetical protein
MRTRKLIAVSWGANERVMMLNAHMARQKQKMFKTFKKINTPSGPYIIQIQNFPPIIQIMSTNKITSF